MTKIKCVFAALLMLTAAALAVWAQEAAPAWPAWEGRNNTGKREWEEMGRWYEEALATDDEALKGMAAELPGKFARQRDGAPFWKKNRDQYQAALASAKNAMEQRRLERERAEAERLAAEQKAERERLAAEAAEQERLAREAAARKAEEERLAAIAAINAKGVTAADFTYDITRDGRGISITGYRGKPTVVTIPSVIEGLPVRELKSTFYRNTTITAVTIPDSITTLVDGEKKLQYGATMHTPGIFEGCTSLSAVTLPRNLKALPGRIFYGCTSLTAFTVPAGVTVVGAEAFSKCTALAKVTLPASLTVIREFAFTDCSGLQTIALPAGLTEIYPGAFIQSGLTAITLPRNLKRLIGSIRHQGDEKRVYEYDARDSGYEITAGVFEECAQLETVTIEAAGIELLRTFIGCKSLKTLTINGNITLEYADSGWPALDGCDNLTTVNIGPRVTKIGNVDMLIETGKLSIQSRAALARLR